MSRLLLICAIIILVFADSKTGQSAEPRTVYSIVKELHDFDWYKAQSIEWRKIIDREPENAKAWLNYYTANRMAGITNRKAYTEDKKNFKQLEDILKEMEDHIKGTFEYHYIRCWNNGPYTPEGEKDLLKALELKRESNELYDELAVYYEIRRDRKNFDKYLKEWFDSGDPSPGLLAYNYNVLQSVEDNAIIITNGDNDTYPLWILQRVLAVKKDVGVLNISLMMLDNYREKIFKEYGISEMKIKKKTPGTMAEILKHIVKNSGKRPVYVGSTLNSKFMEEIKDNLYITGLAMKYSEEDFDNLSVLKNNFMNNFALDYLKIEFSNDITRELVDRMNMNFFPILLKLYDHFKISSDLNGKDFVYKTAEMIAKKAGNEKYLEYFK